MKTKLIALLVSCAAASSFVSAESITAKDALDKIKLSGDFRLRNDYADADNSKERNRLRYRLRLTAKAQVNESIKAEVRLASGSADPVSTNQSFDDGASSKELWIDRAYITYKEGDLSIYGGKMPVKFAKVSNLMWDGDLNPEGAGFDWQLSDSLKLVTNGWLLEESRSGSEATMLGSQLVLEDSGLLAAVGYYQYSPLIGEDAIGPNDFNFYGNSTLSDSYTQDYAIADLNLSYKFELAGLPVKAIASYAYNTKADNGQDTAYLVGASVGKVKQPGDMSFDYNYRTLDADSVLGQFADSDSCGGGTDCSGHYFRVKYRAMRNLDAAAIFFVNERDEFVNGEAEDYSRVMIDLQAKF